MNFFLQDVMSEEKMVPFVVCVDDGARIWRR
jgi:hypothetical protein